MYLDRFLTEYDDTLSSEMNIDPLGLLVIWSAYGQAIFHNRVNSISNDVRNYTINLFHHYVIKGLVEDDGVVLGRALSEKYANKNELQFKHACLIHMENLYVYSMIAGQEAKGVDTGGVLGISNARRQWNESGGNPRLLFGHSAKSQVLVRQPLLGISGRYKTPLMEMRFFDRHYRYDAPQGVEPWQTAATLVDSVDALGQLYRQLRLHMTGLMASRGKRDLDVDFATIGDELKAAYVNAFTSPAMVGKYASDFWLGLTELDQGAAGSLYRVIKSTAKGNQLGKLPLPQLFSRARLELLEGQAEERIKIDHVLLLEPFLTELDLLFNLILAGKSQSVDDVEAAWRVMGRDETTLPAQANRLMADSTIKSRLSVTGKSRLTRLLAVAERDTVIAQIALLLDYHAAVMSSRGQLPWVKLSDSTLKLDVPARKAPKPDERTADYWANSYYISQFRNLLRGLWGMAS